MVCLPLRAGNSNRSDLQAIVTSLLAQRGDAITNEVSSVVWIEAQSHARAIYNLWAVLLKMSRQFDPRTMTDFLSRWESIMGLAALPTDTIQDRQARLTAKFAMINKPPNTQNVKDILELALDGIFLDLINTTDDQAIAAFPGGVPITGGITNILDESWLSTIQKLFIEVIHPSYMNDNTFYNTVNQIAPLLNSFLPAYDTFSWFTSSFSDDGTGDATVNRGIISCSVGSTSVTGVNTAWITPINVSNGVCSISVGSIIEAYDDDGVWRRMEVASIIDDTHLTITEPCINGITNKNYVIQGFFVDCSSSDFPYPPPNCKNTDNAGLM